MLICGDVAVVEDDVKVVLPESIRKEKNNLLINLEGALVESPDLASVVSKPWVVNGKPFFEKLSAEFNVICGLSNNHLFDSPELGGQTIAFLKDQSVPATGARYESTCMTEPVRISEKNLIVSIICAGWDVIGCPNERNFGTNQLDKRKLLKTISAERSSVDRVVVYLHWGYEMEIYPHPADRRLAHYLIDAGADLIVGCHSHCMMGVERYKGKTIAYGVGNFAFSRNWFMNGRINFPSICDEGVCVNYDPETECSEFLTTAHFNNRLSISPMTPMSKESLAELSSPLLLDLKGYEVFFRDNRRKKKFLPIFFDHGDGIFNRIKKSFLRGRGMLIRRGFLLGLKGGPK